MDNTELIYAGIDTEEILDRFMHNTILMRRIIGKFMEDQTFLLLKDAILRNDMAAAEFACHSLKGMCGNLSQKTLFDFFQKQLSLFRTGRYEQAVEMMTQITREYENTMLHLKRWLEQ